MTDTTAGRGGVGIRLYVSGGEVVKRTFDQVGDSGKKMWAELATGGRPVNPALRALSAGVGEVRTGIDGLASRAGAAGTVLGSFGAAGVAAAAVLGGLAIALTKTREAMEFAATLTDTADRIGVGVEALQGFRYVADEAGVSTDAFESNLERLNNTLGAFKTGIGDGKVKPVFEALGITQDQLATVQSADALMLILADTLGKVQDRAVQVRFAKALGVEESLPILRLGSDGIQRLTEDAERLGLVMGGDVVAALDAADRQMEVAQQRIDGSLRLAVAGLADEFADLVTSIAGGLGALNRFFDTYREKRKVAELAYGSETVDAFMRGDLWGAGKGIIQNTFNGNAGRIMNADANGQSESPDDPAFVRRLLGTSPSGAGFAAAERDGSSGGGSGRGAAQAARQAEQRQQRFDRVNDQILRLSGEVQRAMNGQFRSIEESAGIARIMLAEETKQRDLLIQRGQEEYARSDGLRGISDAEAAILRAKEAELAAAKSDALLQEERRDLAAYRLQQDEAKVQDAVALLDIDAQMATTATERYRLEREILIATMEIARRRKKAALESDPNLDDAGRAAELERGDAIDSRRIEAFDQREEDRIRETFKSAGREVVDAIRAGRLGEYIGDRLKEKLMDGALDALFNALGGGGRKGGGGFWNGLLNFGMQAFGKGGGKAAGGGTRAGFAYGMAEHGPELFMLGGQGQVTSFAETARMVQELGGGQGASGLSQPMSVSATYAPNITVNGSGPEVDALRRELAAERANFRASVIDTVNDAIGRRQIGG